MLIESSKDAALAAANNVALAGVISTAVVAIVAVAVQLILARVSTVSTERLRRYNELVELYTEVGALLSIDVTLFVRLFHEALDKPAAAGRALSKAVGAMESLADTRNPRHSLNMLRLHRAGPEVIEAQKLLFKEMDVEAAEGTPTSAIPAWVEARIKVVESALSAFYVTAGDDARTQRESIGFFKVSR